MTESIQPARHIKGSLEPVPQVQKREYPEEEYGVVILPPILGETNEELSSYPEDYIEYSMQRMKAYKEVHGELPEWKAAGGEDEGREAEGL